VVEHEIDAAPSGQLADARNDILAAVVDDTVSSHRVGKGGLLLGADGSDHGHSHQLCKLHQG